MHPLLRLPPPLHDLIRSHLPTKDGLALGASSSWLLELHRLNARHLTLRGRAPPSSSPSPTGPSLHALASLLARQQGSALRELRVRIVEGLSACYPPPVPAAAAGALAAEQQEEGEDPFLIDAPPTPMPLPLSIPPPPPNAWLAAAGAPTGAGDLMLISDDEEDSEDESDRGPLAPPPVVAAGLLPHPPTLPPLPCLPCVERLVLEAVEDDEKEDEDGDEDEEGRRIKRDNTLHATLAAVLLCPGASPSPTPARALLVTGLLGGLLAPGVLPCLHTLVLEGKDLLDEWGLERLGQALEARHQHHQHQQAPPRTTVPLTTLTLEPPSLTQGRGLARVLLSGACDGLERLTLRRVNVLGMSAVAHFLACPQRSGRLRALSLFRREGHLAWADPVAEVLAAGGAPALEALHMSFFPFGSQAADAFIQRRLLVRPLRELRLTAAGLREHDLINLLAAPQQQPQHALAALRVLRLDFRRVPAALLAHALATGRLPRLETLGLVHCRLGDAGIRELAQALARPRSSSSSLRHLDVAFNGIGPQGAEALARWCLGELSALEQLRLDGNPLGEAGVACLAQALLRPSKAAAGAAAQHAAAAAAASRAMCIPITDHEQPPPPTTPAAKLRTLELRRVELGRGAVHALVQALLAGGAPGLESMVLGTPHTRGMAAGDGSNGYVEVGALDASIRQLLRAGRPGLRVRQEAGSLYMGLV